MLFLTILLTVIASALYVRHHRTRIELKEALEAGQALRERLANNAKITKETLDETLRDLEEKHPRTVGLDGRPVELDGTPEEAFRDSSPARPGLYGLSEVSAAEEEGMRLRENLLFSIRSDALEEYKSKVLLIPSTGVFISAELLNQVMDSRLSSLERQELMESGIIGQVFADYRRIAAERIAETGGLS